MSYEHYQLVSVQNNGYHNPRVSGAAITTYSNLYKWKISDFRNYISYFDNLQFTVNFDIKFFDI